MLTEIRKVVRNVWIVLVRPPVIRVVVDRPPVVRVVVVVVVALHHV